MNHFAYADDLALVPPTASAQNKLLDIHQSFASKQFIIYSVWKTLCIRDYTIE